ncbi:DUF1194 domain-containing protein [Vannielia sp.]|uniref:DUF1194 domain-containing protein n=1 Tax=Vannielia sp. TaxID=2813045 RepID=UPI003BAC3DF2
MILLMRAALLALALSTLPAQAQPIEVDVELALMVDVSRSMTPNEVEIQRRGYAEAILSNEVMTAVQSGLLGSIAVTYVEWAGDYTQREIVPWTVIQTPQDARAFAEALSQTFAGGMRRTSISGAIEFAADSIESNAFSGLRRVIDVSGDGPNNQGPLVERARDAALAKGIVINGLPLMTNEGLSGNWDIGGLDLYYRDCVIGGAGAFVIPVHEWSEFAQAVRRKLVLEIAGLPPPAQIIRAQGPFDCQIGEKMWEQRRRYWDEP